VYRPLVIAGKNILPPVDRKAIESEAQAIINQVSNAIKLG
jgi:hypothetical protein